MKKSFMSYFKYVLLLGGMLLLIGPSLLKHINKNKDEQNIQNFINNPVSLDFEDLFNMNDYVQEQYVDDTFKEHDPFETEHETQEETNSESQVSAEQKRVDRLMKLLASTDEVNAAVIIPKIDIKVPVFYGTKGKVLEVGAGFIEGTKLPTGQLGENSFLAAHRGTYWSKTFHDLGKLDVGDSFYILIGDIVMSYQVIETEIVKPWQFDAYKTNPEKALLTLYTCDPIPTFENRLLVVGELQDISKLKDLNLSYLW